MAADYAGLDEGQGLPLTPERRQAITWRVSIANSASAGALDRIQHALTNEANAALPVQGDPARPAISAIERVMEGQDDLIIVTIPVVPPWVGQQA
jgi:hypothetical protein